MSDGPGPADHFGPITLPPHGLDPTELKLLVTWHMPFGKYKGTLLADLPGEYLGWFARNGFPEGRLGHLLALMHEISHNGLRDLLTPLRDPPSRKAD